MSWADDMRCLYCDGRLPLYRKITSGQFCCTAHRKAYWQEQERLAVERLHQTHDTLHAYRPHGDAREIAAILRRLPDFDSDPVAPPAAPWWMTLVNRAEIPMAQRIAPAHLGTPRWPDDGLAGASPSPFVPNRTVRRPVHLAALYDCEFAYGRPASLEQLRPRSDASTPSLSARIIDLAPIPHAIRPMQPLASGIQPAFETISSTAEETPAMAGLLAILGVRLIDGDFSRYALAGPLSITTRPKLPAINEIALRAGLSSAQLLGLPALPLAGLAPAAPRNETVAALSADPDQPLFRNATPSMFPRLRLAPRRRYSLSTVSADRAAAPPVVPFIEHLVPDPPDVVLPYRPGGVVRVKPAAARNSRPAVVEEPSPAGVVSLRGLQRTAEPAKEMRPAPAAFLLPQTPRTDPLRPRLKLEPIVAKPVTDAAPAMTVPPEPFRESAKSTTEQEAERAQVWKLAADFWKRAPRDLKILAVAIPVLIGLALHPALPKVKVSGPTKAAAMEHGLKKAWSTQWVSFRESMVERAAVALDEDFRSGLDAWTSRGDAATEWSFDGNGFVRPGALALYRPSLALTDYQVQFLGLIDKKALSWVVRAADFNHYYVVKLVVLKPGPLPSIGVTRYAVVNGRADSRMDVAAPIDARPDMLYRVRMDVHGQDYSLFVQDQLIDSWSEPRLAHGGIGFFTAHGEQSRLRWVQITHQYDMLGRLCAYLAPYNISQSTEGGSWQ